MKILAVDPGEKRIGLAISDPTGTLARPLKVLKHVAREKDAQKITDIAIKEDVDLILVGWALDSNGEVSYQARKSRRLADAIQEITSLPVKMWDESGTTQEAIKSRIAIGGNRKKRRGHLDDIAASILLQDFMNCYPEMLKNKENRCAEKE